MKIKFKKQEYQINAIENVVDLFDGQIKEEYRINYEDISFQSTFLPNDIVLNNLNVPNEKIIENMQKIQEKNYLIKTNSLDNKTFCVEMETGTGKTYVYIKTIFELNKKYGFKKFIIVVPSMAIKQGVFKTFEMMEYELKNYNEIYDVFIYDSKKLNQIKNFATSNNIQIMIINTQSFIKKNENIINQENDKLSRMPIEYIKKTNPIVIIDEPQSIEGEKSKEAIKNLNPLILLKYSATHKEKTNLIYRLTPVDAFERGLVKGISVSSVLLSQNFNKPYLKLLEVLGSDGKKPKARIELDILKNGKIKRCKRILKQGDILKEISGREEYEYYNISNIDCAKNNEYVEFSNSEKLYLNKSIGDINDDSIKKELIKRTIEHHLDKECEYIKKGIKVLSLFFIDKVDKYRLDNNKKGLYAEMFEECYTELINLPKYNLLKERFPHSVEKIHNGYFSKDKYGNIINTKGEKNEDDNTYKTIMKDKEYLLSFECPLRFIFSHSALKEGWDNPNVFQICVLIDQKSKFSARQKIGRGLRLCVNQDGERVEDRDINILHVISSEKFEDFAKNLQKEIEQETGFKFGFIDVYSLIGKVYLDEITKTEKKLKEEEVEEILKIFKDKKYIDSNSKFTTILKNAYENGTIEIPDSLKGARSIINEIVFKSIRGLNIKNANDQVRIKLNEEILNSKEFIKIWDKIKFKTKYKINWDKKIENLYKEKCIEAIRNKLEINATHITTTNATISVKNDGVYSTYKNQKIINIESENRPKLKSIKNIAINSKVHINLVTEILLKSGKLKFIFNDPIKFEEEVIDILKDIKDKVVFEKTSEGKYLNISYEKIKGEEYKIEEIFEKEKIVYCKDEYKTKIENNKSPYNIVICDSKIEKNFAEELKNDDEVEIFFKLPPKFKIDTPIGTYNPDWAFVYNSNKKEKIVYFVIETKGTIDKFNLRNTEKFKFECGVMHFEALNKENEDKNAIKFDLVKDWKNYKIKIINE